MNKYQKKAAGLARRKRRVRAKIFGTPERPRLCVHSTLDPEFRATGKVGSNKEAAAFVGELVGKRAIEKGITTVRFDRGGRIYHGRVQALADGARSAGLKF